jgi:hypothetical protein
MRSGPVDQHSVGNSQGNYYLDSAPSVALGTEVLINRIDELMSNQDSVINIVDVNTSRLQLSSAV